MCSLAFKSVLLTLWAGDNLGRPYPRETPFHPMPLSMDEFRWFFARLFPETGKDDRGKTKKIPRDMKASFLSWLAGATGLSETAITETMGPTLDMMFGEIEQELGRVPPEALDPKYILQFIIERDK